MTPLTISIVCGVTFVLSLAVGITAQVMKMKSFHKDFFSGKGVFDTKAIVVIVAFALAGLSALGGLIALAFHFFGQNVEQVSMLF